jgi:RimJ/RimL family protein N-acetyltransferase
MEFVRLPSGRQVVIRPIRPADADELQAAHDRLSPHTRYLRFHGVKPHLAPSETHYLVSVDGRDHVALVATPVDEPERIAAVARFVRLPDEPDIAEFAIVVGDDFQHDGLGYALMAALTDAAALRGVRTFRANVLAENRAMHRLIRRLPGRVVREAHEGPADEIDLELCASPVAAAA